LIQLRDPDLKRKEISAYFHSDALLKSWDEVLSLYRGISMKVSSLELFAFPPTNTARGKTLILRQVSHKLKIPFLIKI